MFHLSNYSASINVTFVFKKVTFATLLLTFVMNFFVVKLLTCFVVFSLVLVWMLDFIFVFLSISLLLQATLLSLVYLFYLPFFRFLTDGFYSLVLRDWLEIIHLLTFSFSDFWHHLCYFLIMNFIADFQAWLMRTIMVKEHLEKKVFELARGLWDRQNSINHISSH